MRKNGLDIIKVLKEQNEELGEIAAAERIDLLIRALEPNRPIFLNALREVELLDTEKL